MSNKFSKMQHKSHTNKKDRNIWRVPSKSSMISGFKQ